MVIYDVDSVDDERPRLHRHGAPGDGRTTHHPHHHSHYEDPNQEIYDTNDDDDNHSFRTMSRHMLLDSASARSDSITVTCTGRGSAVGGSEKTIITAERLQQQKDFYESGQWGVISRRDKICFVMTLVLLLCGISMAIIYATTIRGDAEATTNWDGSGTSIGLNRTKIYPNDTLYYTVTEQYDALRNAIVTFTPESIASQMLLHIPERLVDFQANAGNDVVGINESSKIGNVYQQAMSWLLYNDSVTLKYASELVSRYVLIVTYFHNGGHVSQWTNLEQWMTSYHVCLWYGVRCVNRNQQNSPDIIEIDLSDNGLTGSIHLAWALLPKCKSIFINSNQITGTIPGVVFGNMLSLEDLYLQNNMLFGTVPSTLKSITSVHTKTSALNTLFVQGNPNLTGTWPVEFCPSSSSNDDPRNNVSSTGIKPINAYGMNCESVQCSCCESSLHCFN